MKIADDVLNFQFLIGDLNVCKLSKQVVSSNEEDIFSSRVCCDGSYSCLFNRCFLNRIHELFVQFERVVQIRVFDVKYDLSISPSYNEPLWMHSTAHY